MLLARVVHVNFDHFVRDLRAGDPVVWAILIGMVFFTALGMYQKYRSLCAQRATECNYGVEEEAPAGPNCQVPASWRETR